MNTHPYFEEDELTDINDKRRARVLRALLFVWSILFTGGLIMNLSAIVESAS